MHAYSYSDWTIHSSVMYYWLSSLIDACLWNSSTIWTGNPADWWAFSVPHISPINLSWLAPRAPAPWWTTPAGGLKYIGECGVNIALSGGGAGWAPNGQEDKYSKDCQPNVRTGGDPFHILWSSATSWHSERFMAQGRPRGGCPIRTPCSNSVMIIKISISLVYLTSSLSFHYYLYSSTENVSMYLHDSYSIINSKF